MALRRRRRQDAADEALVNSLYEQHGRALLAYAATLTGDRAGAEDVVQETLVRAWKHSDKLLNDKGSVRGWLLTVARNIVIDQARARAARPIEVAAPPSASPVERDHSDLVVDTLSVLDALDRLPGSHRAVLVELYFQGHSVAETANILGIPPGTVKSRSHHALRQLRDAFSRPLSTAKGIAS
jgi:RNA polymerase sigma-70 factor, ECF subfamily